MAPRRNAPKSTLPGAAARPASADESKKRSEVSGEEPSPRLLLGLVAAGEGQRDGVLLGQGGQLLEELAEHDGAVDGVLHPQRLRLLLDGGGAAGALEQGAVQRLAAVAHVREGQLGGVPRPGRAAGSPKESERLRVGTAPGESAQSTLPRATRYCWAFFSMAGKSS
ncbi:hypothetical protein EYF80_044517 [Liparis tanakae]|uniref:Uncharacterized protein n=1 Tax=Liparis tanakae TaxID=230148 RepID=A0A4Z2FVN7_9TELE|nr:hypothetical protein EYF80_044517 [Liparis tanakae]